MAELAPDFIHPVFNKTIRELLEMTEDKSSVKRWSPNKTIQSKPAELDFEITKS
jgi:hypothetical protein